jgi:RNA polymerase sigma factor (TIGR02999 family)
MEIAPSALIAAAEKGDLSASDSLFSILYRELRRVAKRELARQHLPISLSATTLLHKTYLEMASMDEALFPERMAFMSYAARVMRGLIIDYARERHAIKRGGQFEFTSLEGGLDQAADDRELSKVSEALDELALVEPLLAQIVDLKFFCGLTFSEIAAMKRLSERTVQRHWEKARIYLHHAIR